MTANEDRHPSENAMYQPVEGGGQPIFQAQTDGAIGFITNSQMQPNRTCDWVALDECNPIARAIGLHWAVCEEPDRPVGLSLKYGLPTPPPLADTSHFLMGVGPHLRS